LSQQNRAQSGAAADLAFLEHVVAEARAQHLLSCLTG
jgi:hypothetical protein